MTPQCTNSKYLCKESNNETHMRICKVRSCQPTTERRHESTFTKLTSRVPSRLNSCFLDNYLSSPCIYGPKDGFDLITKPFDPADATAKHDSAECSHSEGQKRRRRHTNRQSSMGNSNRRLQQHDYDFRELLRALYHIQKGLYGTLIASTQALANAPSWTRYTNMLQHMQRLPCQLKLLLTHSRSIVAAWSGQIPTAQAPTFAKTEVLLRLPDATLRAILIDDKWTLQGLKDYIALQYTISNFQMDHRDFYLTVHGRLLRQDHLELRHNNLQRHSCVQVNPRNCMLGGAPKKTRHAFESLNNTKLAERRAKEALKKRKWRNSHHEQLLPEELDQHRQREAERVRNHRLSLESNMSQEEILEYRRNTAEQSKRRKQLETSENAEARKKNDRERQRESRHRRKQGLPESIQLPNPLPELPQTGILSSNYSNRIARPTHRVDTMPIHDDIPDDLPDLSPRSSPRSNKQGKEDESELPSLPPSSPGCHISSQNLAVPICYQHHESPDKGRPKRIRKPKTFYDPATNRNVLPNSNPSPNQDKGRRKPPPREQMPEGHLAARVPPPPPPAAAALAPAAAPAPSNPLPPVHIPSIQECCDKISSGELNASDVQTLFVDQRHPDIAKCQEKFVKTMYEYAGSMGYCNICRERRPEMRFKSAGVCSECDSSYKKHGVYEFGADNNMDPFHWRNPNNGHTEDYPHHLPALKPIEEMMIALTYVYQKVYKLKNGTNGYRGQILNLEQNVHTLLDALVPHRPENLPLTIVRRADDRIPEGFREFVVRRNAISVWAETLLMRNFLYAGHRLNTNAIASLPANGCVGERLTQLLEGPVKQTALVLQNGEEEKEREDEDDDDDESVDEQARGPYQGGATGALPEEEPIVEGFVGRPIQNQQTEAAQMQDFLERQRQRAQESETDDDQLQWPEEEGMLNDFSTPNIMAKAFPTLFPFGMGDPTSNDRTKSVTFAKAIKHLLNYAVQNPVTGEWTYPFVKHDRWAHYALNTCLRHRHATQKNVFLKNDSEYANLDAAGFKEIMDNQEKLMR
jgi:hypothetical protein